MSGDEEAVADLQEKVALLTQKVDADRRLILLETEFVYLKRLVPAAAALVTGLVGSLLYVFFNITADNLNENVDAILSQTQLAAIEEEAAVKAAKVDMLVASATDLSSAVSHEIDAIRGMLGSDIPALRSSLEEELERARVLTSAVDQAAGLSQQLDTQIKSLRSKLDDLRVLAGDVSAAEQRIRSGRELAGSSWVAWGGATEWSVRFGADGRVTYCTNGGLCVQDGSWSFADGYLIIEGMIVEEGGRSYRVRLKGIVSRSLIVGSVEEWDGRRWEWYAVPQ